MPLIGGKMTTLLENPFEEKFAEIFIEKLKAKEIVVSIINETRYSYDANETLVVRVLTPELKGFVSLTSGKEYFDFIKTLCGTGLKAMYRSRKYDFIRLDTVK
jgi:hypothetical protein